MRRSDVQQRGMFSYVSVESRVPPTHPLRGIKVLLDEALPPCSRAEALARVLARLLVEQPDHVPGALIRSEERHHDRPRAAALAA